MCRNGWIGVGGGGYKVDPHTGSVQPIQGMIGGNYPGNLSLIHASDTYFYSYCIKYMQYYVTNTSHVTKAGIRTQAFSIANIDNISRVDTDKAAHV